MNNRGTCHFELHNFEQALLDFGQRISLNPALAVAFANRARVWEQWKDYGSAIEDWEKARALGLIVRRCLSGASD